MHPCIPREGESGGLNVVCIGSTITVMLINGLLRGQCYSVEDGIAIEGLCSLVRA